MSRVWVIRGGEDNALVDAFVDNGCTGIGFSAVPDGRTVEKDEVVQILLRAEGRNAKRDAAIFEDFVQVIEPGHFVVMPDTPRAEVVVGIVEGDYSFHQELSPEQYRHRRAVRWVGRHGIDQLPPGHEGLYRQRNSLQERSRPELLAHCERVEAGEVGGPAHVRRGSVRRRGPAGSSRSAEPTPVAGRQCASCFTFKASALFAAGEDVCRDCD